LVQDRVDDIIKKSGYRKARELGQEVGDLSTLEG
jgi:hypothetical protein